MSITTQAAAEGLRAVPPVAVTVAATAEGINLNHAVAIATLVYIALQAAYLLWRWRRDHKQGKSGRNNRSGCEQ